MNYQQTYDPMQASAMRQQQNTNFAQSIKGGISGIAQGLRENAAYKQFAAKTKSITDDKARYWDSVSSKLQEANLGVEQFPELANVAALIADKDIDLAHFMAAVTTPLESASEVLFGQKAMSQMTPEERGYRQPTGVGAMKLVATSSPMAAAPGSPTDTITARLMNEQKTGTYDPLVNSANTPYTLDTPKAEDLFLQQTQAAIKDQQTANASGMARRGDTLKLLDLMRKNQESASKERQNEQKLKLAELKAKQEQERATNEKTGGKVIDAAATNEILDASGKVTTINPARVVVSPGDYQIGNRKYNPNSGSGGGAGPVSLQPANLFFKLRNEVAKALYISGNATDFQVLDKIDQTTGMPYKEYIPNPKTTAAAILDDARKGGRFEQYARKINPAAADILQKANYFGAPVQSPTTPSMGYNLKE